mmetsp:Transcript_2874/g.7819  ORF Transcript_2874/g.7819 Transcript_2874/m.7819 type:complete len:640 (-) Transcript_2874:81-2000(-)
MCASTRQRPTTILSSPLIERKRTKKTRVFSIVFIYCTLLLFGVEATTETTTTGLSSRRRFGIVRTNKSVKNQISMSTRSGTRIRGGDNTGSTPGSAGADAATPDANEAKIATQPPASVASDADTASTTPSSDSDSKTTTTTTKKPFSWRDARRTVFPIYGNEEVEKFLLIGAIKFFIIMALTLTRDTKDTLVVTQCGAEAIAFLKIYGVLPAATAFIALYSKMSDLLSKKTLFYTTCIPFFLFFVFFDTVIYPNAARLHPSLASVESVLGITNGSGGGLTVLANIIAHWTSALFYVVAEIYSSVSVGLLFWQYANDVVSVDQAKRFYPLFAQMSGLAPVLAGQYVVHYASRAATFSTSLHRLTAAISFAGCMICFFYHASTSFIEKKEGVKFGSSSGDDAPATAKKKKPKMSMVESIKFLASSQYLRLIASLVLGYGLSINFTEVMWKSLVKKQYPNPLEYQRFMGNFSSAVGASTCIVILFGVHVIRILGWKVGAMATPAIMSVLAAPFFACILLGLDSPARLHIAVILGTIQSLLSKTSKYALFDPTTQMSYIPLDQDSKVKGKAAIDVLGSRIGKSGGSFIQQILVLSFGNIINAAPIVAVIFYSILFAWLSAASKLSTLFVAQTEMDKAEKAKKE